MDSGEIRYLYKETRLNLESTSAASQITIRVPSHGGRNQRKVANDTTTEDETTFRTKNLAASSSIYHRKWHDAPRSFLWRLLDNGAILSIRAVDIYKRVQADDCCLVLNFHFQTPIKPGCVALADPEEHDALCVHILDQASQLYTLTLRPGFFRKRAAVDAKLSELAKVQSPAGLGFKHPHRMLAVSANLLLVTVNDGGIIRFDKTKSDDLSGCLWRESFFNVQGWKQNLRSLLPFQGNHTVRYGKINMEYSAATAVRVTSFGLHEGMFAITICLDHSMRIWNIEDGQILYTGDILNADRTPQEIGKWAIDPSQSNLIQLVGRGRGQRFCATFSPVGSGEFKFWKIIAKDAHHIIVEDLFPNNALVPVTPSLSDVWTLADFALANPEGATIELWTLWKNNISYKVQRLELDRKNVAQSWEQNWDGVYSEGRVPSAQTSGPCDPIDVTEKWLRMILQPGRFTRATLDTALTIYERGLGTPTETNKGCGLAEAICSVLGSTATLDQGSSGTMDYAQFRSSSEIQWRRFYRLLVELDKQRGEAVSLVLDTENEMAWVVCADLVSAITECNTLECLYYNPSYPGQGQEDQAALLNVAISFVDSFSDNFLQLCNATLRGELFEESSKTDLERIQYFSDKSGFWRGITDEDCSLVVDILRPNFEVVTDRLYTEMLDLVAAPADAKRRNLQYPLTEFGRKLIVKAVQDYIEVQWTVCFSQLILLVHMEFEFDTEEEALHRRVDIGSTYRQLVDSLKRLELLKWLSSTQLAVPLSMSDKGSSPADENRNGDDTQVITALEAYVGHLLGFGNISEESPAAGITNLVSNLCAADSDIEISPPLIQCSLIRRERADLALDLGQFRDQSPFSVYVEGRVLLALKDFGAAGIDFKRAAIGMSTANAQTDRHSSGLIDETEWNLLHNGLAKYYSHIVALFEQHKAYSYVIEFARLAIQFLSLEDDATLTKTDMLSRLFNAAVATSQFEVALTSLSSLKDSALRNSSLRKLVHKMCETYHSSELVSLPFPGMQQEVDDILAQRCRSNTDMQGVPYHQILYSWRIKHNNYRGAASVLLDRIQKLRMAGEGDRIASEDVLDTPVTRQYLLLINALSCVDAKQAWIFDEGTAGLERQGAEPVKRKVLSLADIRKQYQDELDRVAAIQNNQFGFEASDIMEIS